MGILRRASERGKNLPPQLEAALKMQAGMHTDDSVAPTMAGADGGGGRNPVGLLFAAAFSAGAGASAGSIGFTEEGTPTLKGSSGGNTVPAVLFENHGIDSRYTGPHPIAPTMSAQYGTGGSNVPLVGQEEPVLCIMGNAINCQPHNGGNGIGVQPELAYTLTAKDNHAVFNRQRVDAFRNEDVASTESARQHKDATDLVMQGACPFLIRRLTPLECERLQGFPDGWTDIEGASDSSRYKALGNSVAIPCVEYIMRGITKAFAPVYEQ